MQYFWRAIFCLDKYLQSKNYTQVSHYFILHGKKKRKEKEKALITKCQNNSQNKLFYNLY